MDTTNIIGLDKKAALQLTEQLNALLANYQLFYMNVRGFHWNIKGEDFFQLHSKFEELYTDALDKIDELAERILTLGSQPLHSYTDYLKATTIVETTNVSDGKVALTSVIGSYQVLLEKERIILREAQELDDEGTVTLISDYIAQQEKEIWMFTSYLS